MRSSSLLSGMTTVCHCYHISGKLYNGRFWPPPRQSWLKHCLSFGISKSELISLCFAAPCVSLGPHVCVGKSVEGPSRPEAGGQNLTQGGIRKSLKVRQQTCSEKDRIIWHSPQPLTVSLNLGLQMISKDVVAHNTHAIRVVTTKSPWQLSC